MQRPRLLPRLRLRKLSPLPRMRRISRPRRIVAVPSLLSIFLVSGWLGTPRFRPWWASNHRRARRNAEILIPRWLNGLVYSCMCIPLFYLWKIFNANTFFENKVEFCILKLVVHVQYLMSHNFDQSRIYGICCQFWIDVFKKLWKNLVKSQFAWVCFDASISRIF